MSDTPRTDALENGTCSFSATADLCRQLEIECARLRHLLDTRPALNAGLIEAYHAWTGMVYAFDMPIIKRTTAAH